MLQDEIDAIGVARGSDGEGGTSVQDRVLSQMLNEIDGITPLHNVLVLAATNRPQVIVSSNHNTSICWSLTCLFLGQRINATRTYRSGYLYSSSG